MKSDAGTVAAVDAAAACAGAAIPISARTAACVGGTTLGRGAGAAGGLSAFVVATNAAAPAAAPLRNRRRPSAFFFVLLDWSDTGNLPEIFGECYDVALAREMEIG